MTPDVDPVTTGFEFDDADGFVVGTTPFTADFQGGEAKTAGDPALYVDGTHAWHVVPGDTGTATFETPLSQLTFNVRMVNGLDVGSVEILDVNGAVIQTIVPNNAYQEITVTRDPATETLIGSMEASVSGLSAGDLVMDVVTLEYPSSAANNEFGCVISTANDFACIISDAATGSFIAGVQGTLDVSVDAVTGTGMIYAAPGEVFADASTIASVTIDGTVAEGTTLDLTIDGTGVPITVTSTYDSNVADRGSDLATVEASYTTFDIFTDPSTFDVDATGAISGQSGQGCGLMGQVSVIDSALNAYGVDITVTDGGNCGIPDGDYAGLGATLDENATDDGFVFGVFVDGVSMFLGYAVK